MTNLYNIYSIIQPYKMSSLFCDTGGREVEKPSFLFQGLEWGI